MQQTLCLLVLLFAGLRTRWFRESVVSGSVVRGCGGSGTVPVQRVVTHGFGVIGRRRLGERCFEGSVAEGWVD